MEIISSSTVETNQTTGIFFCNKQIKVYFRPPYLKHVFVASHFLKFNVVRKKECVSPGLLQSGLHGDFFPHVFIGPFNVHHI